MKDKYSAVWVSHSSISDYLQCPRAYFLRNVYRDRKTNHKVSLVSPTLALGQVVHEVIESLSKLPLADRFNEPLLNAFERVWKNVSGRKGGFADKVEEEQVKDRGIRMITRVMKHPGILKEKAIKIRQELPYYWISEEENIILCGKIDWLEYREATDSVRIVDFKTGKYDEDPGSLQLPIYYLIVKNTQSRLVTGASYWYLDRDDEPIEAALPDPIESQKRVVDVAKKIALARKLERFLCKNKEGCRSCRPYESIVNGEGEFVGVNSFGQDLYVLPASIHTYSVVSTDGSEMPF